MTATKSVAEAWADVMADVQALGKDQRVDSGPARFNFRGVDDVMNAVGPVLRTHRVAVIPSEVQTHMRDVTTNKGAVMREATVRVTYTIVGPDGSTLTGAAAGEAADSGDKATPKAMSVAFRTFLLQSLCLPTNEPDPDRTQYERADDGLAEPQETPEQQALRGIAQATDLATLEQIGQWAARQHLGPEVQARYEARRQELAA